MSSFPSPLPIIGLRAACACIALALIPMGAEAGVGIELYHGVDGKQAPLPGREECKALALIFIAHECPISNAYAPEIARMCREFTPLGVSFRVVYAESDLSAAAAARHSREFAFGCPAIIDSDLRLARRVGAEMTPQAVLLAPSGLVLYRGRIDDIFADFGKRRPQPTRRELRDAIEAVLAGRPVASPRTDGIGCHIFFGSVGKPLR